MALPCAQRTNLPRLKMVEPIFDVPVIGESPDKLIAKEWIVTNGLGGYSSGTVLGVNTRRHHGLFVPNLPAPRGRTMMLPHLAESLEIDEEFVSLTGTEPSSSTLDFPAAKLLKQFRLDWQTPTWRFEVKGRCLEKKIFMPYGKNTVYVSYQLLDGSPVRLSFRPFGACRKHDSQLGYPHKWPFRVTGNDHRYELQAFDGAPIVRMMVRPSKEVFLDESKIIRNIFYRIEFERGLDCIESLYSPGVFSVDLSVEEPVYFAASTEDWASLDNSPAQAFEDEVARRKKLLSSCRSASGHIVTAQLTLAADQFIVSPKTRNEKQTTADATDQPCTIIAGYHWFTDWGRDTMISLEGLTLCTGRAEQAKAILKTFAHYVRNGLLPNHFPEGERQAIYNTVDATFWYFHAIDRYLEHTKDHDLIKLLYPTLKSIINHHIQGTDFGIHMDPADGLISAAAEGYQLTWMDAKVDEWVVTPRRGKPVEIQALWFNALKLMEQWGQALNEPVADYRVLAEKVHTSFNTHFWFTEGGYLYDVIDAERGYDIALRPNQIFAISLRYPVLKSECWKAVIDIVEEKLLTPLGLRTLDPAHPDYHGRYEGDRWNRDAAYHQGLVWAWLIGHFVDAWKKVYHDPQKAREFFQAFEIHLGEAAIGTISEIFDGDSPYQPRGCIAQAWSVAEVLRCFIHLLQDKK